MKKRKKRKEFESELCLCRYNGTNWCVEKNTPCIHKNGCVELVENYLNSKVATEMATIY